MSCSVAVASSPVFSPSSSRFCNKSSISSPAESLTLTHLKSSSSSSSSQSPSSSPSSPCSPFRFRIQKPPIVFPPSSFAPASPSAPATVAKRKRPARLDIPTVSMGFGGLPTPKAAAVERAEMEREGVGYSVYCKRGRREAMEDRFSAMIDLQGDPKQVMFGVFDGHGGAKAAEFAAKHLNNNIWDEAVSRGGDVEIEEVVKHGYLKTDSQFLKEETRGGSCCVTALIRNGDLVVSNAGDCRAVMSNAGVAEALTSDHRPCREDEKARIENLGGYVDLVHSTWRIQDSLAVSRGIGDGHLKQWVIAEPETKVIPVKPQHEFLILASDGLWEKVGNQEAVDIARSHCVGVDKPELLSACKQLVDLSASRGSLDDITVMLIQLKPYI